MRAIRVGMNSKFEASIGAIKRAIGRETCMVFDTLSYSNIDTFVLKIVASAPSFVNGVMDNIEEIAQVLIPH
jgi:glutamate/tyrosine decarboxylase-like PLP-dependent enzyme